MNKIWSDRAWSRHISEEHRLVYNIVNGDLWVIACKGHYE
ncbi:MAG: type II toxin-antitoxin system YoeB family toxin [Oscillospiraceae bacterium]|nr:type II toxin-antitoxin system YoeB family toxin [Oscillospiraceae bacterium]MBQ8979300.1 type II toxin-antitoxin system YoeB family toxin [Oscillospiraceae bacterium]